MNTKVLFSTLAITGLALSAAACSANKSADNGATVDTLTTSGVALNGAGATFPYPIYSKWFSDYAAATGTKINYQSIGSGGGIRQLSAQTVDFGASDSPMSDEEMAKATGGEIIHIPTVMGAVVVTYNLPSISTPLNLTSDLVADIFLGKITKWNDPKISAVNSGVTLPSENILVAHRSDGSGTTFIFTDYLATVSDAWNKGPGRGKEVKWPAGLGAKGNEGVAGQVKQIPGSIGYVELAYAKQNSLQYANIRNKAGKFVTPSIASVTAAAAGTASELPADTDYRVSIVNAPGDESYPISSFTWILVYENQLKTEKGKKLADFLNWMLANGASSAEALDYAPLPKNIVDDLTKRLSAASN